MFLAARTLKPFEDTVHVPLWKLSHLFTLCHVQCVVCSCHIHVYMMCVCVCTCVVCRTLQYTAGTPKCNWPLTLMWEIER